MTETGTVNGRHTGAAAERSGSPDRAGLVLGALIAVAAVANLGLAVANVALPSIGKEFDASQTSLNLLAVGYSLGLAASVLGATLVFVKFPRRDEEKRLLAAYQAQDTVAAPEPAESVHARVTSEKSA